jgi:quercetin dioxygenase-like cupin family protein
VRYFIRFSLPVVLLSLGIMPHRAAAQLEPPCAVDSPERRGEVGCSLVETKLLPARLGLTLLWHIDRFSNATDAQAALSATSIAFNAHGAWWLMSVEPNSDNHHGGTHVASVPLPPLPPAERYAMLAMSAFIPAGLTSRIHVHSGVEGFYVVDGEQCLETVARTYAMPKGTAVMVGAGETMRLVATGPDPRRALAVVVYDAARPPTTRPDNPPTLAACARK